MKELDINHLRGLAIEATKDYDPEEYFEEINGVIHPHIKNYLKELVEVEGLPENWEGWDFNDIELRLVKLDENKYIPSVRSDYWDAPASTWGIEFDDPIDALTIGLTDAISEQLAAELTDEDEEID